MERKELTLMSDNDHPARRLGGQACRQHARCLLVQAAMSEIGTGSAERYSAPNSVQERRVRPAAAIACQDVLPPGVALHAERFVSAHIDHSCCVRLDDEETAGRVTRSYTLLAAAAPPPPHEVRWHPIDLGMSL